MAHAYFGWMACSMGCHVYGNTTGVLPVVVHVNRSVPGLTVTGVSSVSGILCMWKRVSDIADVDMKST